MIFTLEMRFWNTLFRILKCLESLHGTSLFLCYLITPPHISGLLLGKIFVPLHPNIQVPSFSAPFGRLYVWGLQKK